MCFFSICFRKILFNIFSLLPLVENFSDYGAQIWQNIFDFDSETIAEVAARVLGSGSIDKLPLSFCDLFRPVFFSVDYCSLKNLQKFDKGKFWKAVGSCVAPIFVLFQAWGTDDKQSCLAFLKEKGFNVVHTVDQPIQYKGTSFVGDPITQKVCLLIYCF